MVPINSTMHIIQETTENDLKLRSRMKHYFKCTKNKLNQRFLKSSIQTPEQSSSFQKFVVENVASSSFKEGNEKKDKVMSTKMSFNLERSKSNKTSKAERLSINRSNKECIKEGSSNSDILKGSRIGMFIKNNHYRPSTGGIKRQKKIGNRLSRGETDSFSRELVTGW